MRKYVEHLTHLSIKRQERAEQRVHKAQQEKGKDYSDYDWKNLFEEGMLAKLTVNALDKYLTHFNLKNTLKLRKAEKFQAIQRHVIATMDTGQNGNNSTEDMEVESQGQAIQEQDSEENVYSKTSEDDIVLRDMNSSDSSSQSSSEETDLFDATSLFTTLRSGRVAINHRAAHYVSSNFFCP